jgi:putative sigma-54 modulation protein
MEITTTGKHLDITDAMRDYVGKKIGSLEKYFRREGDWANVILCTEGGQFLAEVSLGGGGIVIYAKAYTPDMYASIDEVADKLKKQIKKYKEKIKTEKQRRARLVVAEKKMNYVDVETEMTEFGDQVLKKRIPSEKPMSVEEAKMQLDLGDSIFLVFYNVDTHVINVIYKKKDGKYGVYMP